MEIGFVGLGRMGKNMVLRLLRGGHRVVAWDPNAASVAEVAGAGAVAATGIGDVIAKLGERPRAIWAMVPSGNPTEQVIRDLGGSLERDDIVVDGGNSHYKESVRRAALLRDRGVRFIDSGTSGGIWGLENGYCLMVGGDEAACSRLEPVFHTLAPPDGYLRVGESGSGHFVKMIHNGIEYGLMEAYAEGFEILAASDYRIDLARVASLWRNGSVVRSWLLDLAADALREDPRLEHVKDFVEDSGEGRWTVIESVERAVPAPVLTLALQARFRSRQPASFAGKLLAALRHKFGGHAVKTT
jgi:6-phosphogluconate dehydrogenase